jgi:hypothetical protein
VHYQPGAKTKNLAISKAIFEVVRSEGGGFFSKFNDLPRDTEK